MATITISTESSTDASPTASTITISDDVLALLISAANAQFFPQGYPTTVNGVTTYAPPTKLQTLQAMVGAIATGWAANVAGYQKEAAAAAAVAGIAAPAFTVT